MTGKIYIAAAGSGKTRWIVNNVAESTKPVLVTCFTINTAREIERRLWQHEADGPATLMTWYTFLLRDFCRPYQNVLVDGPRIAGVQLTNRRSAPGASADQRRFYLTRDNRIYTDKIGRFAAEVVKRTNGAPLERLRVLYSKIFVDEVQDLAGWDLELVELLLQSGLPIRLVGDVRQSTYRTNNARKNSGFWGFGVMEKYKEWQRKELCTLEHRSTSHRCPQCICDLADSLFADLDFEPTESARSVERSVHSGVFLVPSEMASKYRDMYGAQALRFDAKTAVPGALNFGESKGLEFDHVLIYPNGPLTKWLKTGDATPLPDSTRAKLYVAITRARCSVAFVMDGEAALPGLIRIAESQTSEP